MTFETIETERLLIQKLDSETMNQIFELNNDDEIKKILGITTDEDFDRQKKIHQQGYQSYNRKMLNFQIVEKQSSVLSETAVFIPGILNIIAPKLVTL